MRFALYIAFFPQLVAGPIVRPHDFLPQLNQKFNICRKLFLAGSGLIWLGLFKKVIIADYLAKYSDAYFGSIEKVHSAWDAILGTYAFAFQIYMDFSGYSDVAIGAALLLGYRIPRNFFYPYSAVSFSDFWRRWHISLSSWFRDYIYIPLGGGKTKKPRNMMITMLLSGLWHGAAWHFVIWGGFHGIALIAEGYLFKLYAHTPKIIKQIIIFNLICVGWVIFRVEDITHVSYFLDHIGTLKMPNITYGSIIAAILCAIIYVYQLSHVKLEVKKHLYSAPLLIQITVHSLLIVSIITLGNFGTPFRYLSQLICLFVEKNCGI